MALSYSLQSSASSDFSDEFSSPESNPHRFMAPPAMSRSQVLAMERDRYSDEDIRILYEIVNRAEEILSELTPSSRLPTHALFKAYDEILPDHGIDPDDDQLISKLVFRVGGVKKATSLKEKFKTVMAQMEITVQVDGPPVYGSDAGDAHANSASNPDELSDVSDAVDPHFAVDKNAYRQSAPAMNGEPDGDDRLHDDAGRNISSGDNHANLSMIEQHLESSAIAFRKKHRNKFSTMGALRQWQKKSGFITNLCDQFAAARQADLEDDVEAKFQFWRAISAEIDVTSPQSLPPNVYSKRIEGIAIRAHEIHAAKTALRYWRLNAREQGHKVRNLEESSDPLERIAAKAHKNLMLSRALANWSNRWEEESEKARMAAKAYEMSLKSKAFGLRPRRDEHPLADAARGVRFNTSPDLSRLDTVSKIPPPIGLGIPADQVDPSGIAIDTHKDISTGLSGREPPSDDISADPMDEMDETTLLARRHILRMRYYDAWERYTAENLQKARDFRADKQDEGKAHVITRWRSQAGKACQDRENMQYNAKRASYYNKAVKALDVWRRECQEKTQGQDHVLDHYATRANFYYKVIEALPVWRNETERAIQQRGVLELYAGRAEYYYKATNSLPIWRRRTQEVAGQEEQTLARYAQRADYYYRSRGALLTWHDFARQKRKKRLKEAHLETRRIVKKGMGERCIAQWREQLQPRLERHEMMDLIMEDVVADREWRQNSETLDVWRKKARQRLELGLISDATVQGKIIEQWRDRSAYHQESQVEAENHWKERALARTLKNWNLSSLQIPNRPLIVANALEKKDRRLMRTSFESWYSRTADMLVPIELADGSYKSVGEVIEDAQHQASLSHARGLLTNWKAAAKSKIESGRQEIYTPTPGRPRIFLGGLSRRETTTPLAPVPSRANWRASESAARSSAIGGRTSRSGRTGRNLRVSWAQ